MNYTSQAELMRMKALSDALRGNNNQQLLPNWASGLAYMLNQYNSGRLDRQATEAEQKNQRIQAEELSRVLMKDNQVPENPLGGFYKTLQKGREGESFQSPGVQDLATSLAVQKMRMQNQKGSYGLTPMYTKGPEGYGAFQLGTDGTVNRVSLPEGHTIIPNAGILGFDPQAIATREGAETTAEVERIQQTAGPQAQATALEAASQSAANNAQEASMNSFEQLAGIRQNIALMGDAAEALRNGAETGPIASRLPSFREQSIKLDNIQAQLGLNVIQNTTFGSLSESELRFALDTALPSNLQGPALAEWIERKVAAQNKLASYIEEAAIFLGTPGNTIADWVASRRENQTPVDQQKPEDKVLMRVGGFTIRQVD